MKTRFLTRSRGAATGLTLLSFCLAGTLFLHAAEPTQRAIQGSAQPLRENFTISRPDLFAEGTNTFFILRPGYELELKGIEQGLGRMLTVRVLDETKLIAGVKTRVVEERWFAGTNTTRVARRYLAISKRTGDLFSFGASIVHFQQGKRTGRHGSWLDGTAGARFGMALAGQPVAGARYSHGRAAGAPVKISEIVSLDETVHSAAGTFENCLKVKESADGTSREKIYGRGIGMVQTGALKLTKYGFETNAPAMEAAIDVADSETETAEAMDEFDPALEDEAEAELAESVWYNGYELFDPMARVALHFVGDDPEATSYWLEAINDPRLSDEERSDLIEDLNENGFSDPDHPGAEDLPLIASRLELIEEIAPFSMDQVNADAFAEAYKDLVNLWNEAMPEPPAAEEESVDPVQVAGQR